MASAKFIRKLGFIFVITAAGTILNGGVAVVSTNTLINSTADVIDSYELISDYENLLRMVVDAETGVRSYALSNDLSFLEPFVVARDQIPGSITRLKIKVYSDSENMTRIAKLESLIIARMAILTRAVENKYNGGPDNTGMTTVMREESKKLMDQIRDIINNADISERGKLSEKLKINSTLVLVEYFSIASTIFVNFIILAYAYKLVADEIDKRANVEAELAKANDALKFKISSDAANIRKYLDRYSESGNERSEILDELSKMFENSADNNAEINKDKR